MKQGDQVYIRPGVTAKGGALANFDHYDDLGQIVAYDKDGKQLISSASEIEPVLIREGARVLDTQAHDPEGVVVENLVLGQSELKASVRTRHNAIRTVPATKLFMPVVRRVVHAPIVVEY